MRRVRAERAAGVANAGTPSAATCARPRVVETDVVGAAEHMEIEKDGTPMPCDPASQAFGRDRQVYHGAGAMASLAMDTAAADGSTRCSGGSMREESALRI